MGERHAWADDAAAGEGGELSVKMAKRSLTQLGWS